MITIKNLFDLIMPEVELPKENEMLGDFIRVNAKDKELRIATHIIARYLMREINIDSVLFPHPNLPSYDDEECHAYLLTLEKSNVQMKSVVIGGFCFRLRDFGYGMQWIWLHPYVRNQGILKKNWLLLENKFGKNFYCEPPYSYAMQVFLKKNDKELFHQQHENLEKISHWWEKL